MLENKDLEWLALRLTRIEASLLMLLSLLFSFSVDPIRQDERRNEMDYGPRNVLTNALMGWR